MKRFSKLFGIIAFAVIIIAFLMAGCGNGTPGGGDVYKLTWGYWEKISYTYVSNTMSANGVILKSAGSNAGYVTGGSAEKAAAYIQSNFPFDESGEETGSFEDLLNFKYDGIGAPSGLKSAMTSQKENMPIGGVFQSDKVNGVVVFYIEKTSGSEESYAEETYALDATLDGSPKVITGTAGTPIDNQTLTINLLNLKVKTALISTDVSSWFNHVVPGLSYTTTAAANAEVITIVVSGTPEDPSDSQIQINIPAGVLNDGMNGTSWEDPMRVNGNCEYYIM